MFQNATTGVLSHHEEVYTMPLLASAGKLLSILVENQGRISIGYGLEDKKVGFPHQILDNRSCFAQIIFYIAYNNAYLYG